MVLQSQIPLAFALRHFLGLLLGQLPGSHPTFATMFFGTGTVLASLLCCCVDVPNTWIYLDLGKFQDTFSDVRYPLQLFHPLMQRKSCK